MVSQPSMCDKRLAIHGELADKGTIRMVGRPSIYDQRLAICGGPADKGIIRMVSQPPHVTRDQPLGIITGRGNPPGSRSGYRSGLGGGMVSNTHAVPVPVVRVVRVVRQHQRTSILG